MNAYEVPLDENGGKVLSGRRDRSIIGNTRDQTRPRRARSSEEAKAEICCRPRAIYQGHALEVLARILARIQARALGFVKTQNMLLRIWAKLLEGATKSSRNQGCAKR